MSHLQALISRTIVHIVLQFVCLSRTIAIGIPIAIVRLRQTNCKTKKTVKQYVQ